MCLKYDYIPQQPLYLRDKRNEKKRSVLEATGTKQITPLFAEAKETLVITISADNHICRNGYWKGGGTGRRGTCGKAKARRQTQPTHPSWTNQGSQSFSDAWEQSVRGSCYTKLHHQS